MSFYAYELKEATTYINKKVFSIVLEKIKQEVRKNKWKCYGWRKTVLDADTLEDVAKEFDIQLANEGDGYYRPVIDGTYISDFFDCLIEIVAPYMTEGEIVVNAEYDIVKIKFGSKCKKQ